MKFYLKSYEKDDRPVYICGNFNGWNPEDQNYKLKKLKKDLFFIEINDKKLNDVIEYKYTKGGWENVELDNQGKTAGNRKMKKELEFTYDVVIIWRLNWGPFKEEYYPIVEVVDEEFYIPQLDKTRKVWALLPHDYYKNPNKKYPVLYLQDAQNLFDEGNPLGNWEIDKKLSILSEYGRGDLIVIAIDHGGKDRIKEYVFQNPRLTKNAEGKKYIRFVTDTLKPYIDAKYRTLKDRDNTGIGGSSLGALISIYCGFMYPEVYSKLLLFSPSLWVEPENNYPLISFQEPFKMKVYLYGGKKESKTMEQRVKTFEKVMEMWEELDLFDFQIRTVINKDGYHQEFFWAQEFPKAIEYLFYDSMEDPLRIIEKAYGSREETYDYE